MNITVNHLANWLAQYLEGAGKKTFVVVNNGTRSDALVLKICSEATLIKKGTGTICIYKEEVPKFFLGKTHKITCAPYEEYMVAQNCANDMNGVVVGSIDKTLGKYNRTYPKIVYSLGDIFPLYDLQYSEIVKITDSLWPDYKYTDKIIDYNAIEFCLRAQDLFGIITSIEPPHKHKIWHTFTTNQKKFIAEAHQREKQTKHKEMQKPYPKIKAT